MSFFQQAPRLGNQFFEDTALRETLERRIPRAVLATIQPSLEKMGKLAAGELAELAERHRSDEPRHVLFDPWGQRVDDVLVNPAWRELSRVAASEGLVATAYERAYGEYSRLHQFALVYLFAPSSQSYTCPLAMTDGCARTLELLASDAQRDTVFGHLVSRRPEDAWTSGQWMTERTGGSDVGLSETVARKEADGWRLYGTKWFTSAVTSEVALTLARPEGNGPGGKGLALFFVRLRRPDGRLNGIVVNRLKEKLGTRHLPTAELTLDGTFAEPVSGLRDGIRNMASMLNITRTWNAVCAVAGMRRAVALARAYAPERRAFGAPLSEKPLHLDTLAGLSAELEAALQLVFYEVHLLGRAEAGVATDEERSLLSVLHPIAKLLTGKMAVSTASEVLECFGGAGYVEDTGLPGLLRDAQVLPIWEGTTNVLSLETLRAFARENAWQPFTNAVARCAAAVRDPDLVEVVQQASEVTRTILGWAGQVAQESQPALEAGARRFAVALGRSLALALLAEHAQWSRGSGRGTRSADAAIRFAAHGLRGPAIPAFDAEAVSRLALG